MTIINGNGKSDTLSGRIWNTSNDHQETRIPLHHNLLHWTTMWEHHATYIDKRSPGSRDSPVIPKSNCTQPMAMGWPEPPKLVHRTGNPPRTYDSQIWRQLAWYNRKPHPGIVGSTTNGGRTCWWHFQLSWTSKWLPHKFMAGNYMGSLLVREYSNFWINTTIYILSDKWYQNYVSLHQARIQTQQARMLELMPNVPSHSVFIGAMHSNWGCPWTPPLATTKSTQEQVYMADHTKTNTRSMAVMAKSSATDILIRMQFSTTDTSGQVALDMDSSYRLVLLQTRWASILTKSTEIFFISMA